MNHVNVRQNRSHLSITSLKIQTRYFISPLANMHIKKHRENHTQPSGEAKLEPWLLNTSTLNAPTTRLEGKRQFVCTEKPKPFPRHHFAILRSLQDAAASVKQDEAQTEQGNGAKPDSLQARSPAPAHRLAQPRASRSPTQGNPRGLSANAVTVLPQETHSYEICHFPPSKRNNVF